MPAVRAGLIPRQERGGGGGGEGRGGRPGPLGLGRAGPMAWWWRGRLLAGSAVATRSERREEAAAAVGVLWPGGSLGGLHLGCCLGGVGGVSDGHEGR